MLVCEWIGLDFAGFFEGLRKVADVLYVEKLFHDLDVLGVRKPVAMCCCHISSFRASTNLSASAMLRHRGARSLRVLLPETPVKICFS